MTHFSVKGVGRVTGSTLKTINTEQLQSQTTLFTLLTLHDCQVYKVEEAKALSTICCR
jgi:hypothetical protein